jgi:hypothetical protein
MKSIRPRGINPRGNQVRQPDLRLRESSFFGGTFETERKLLVSVAMATGNKSVRHQKNENALHQSEVQTQRDRHRPGNWIPVNKSSPETSSDAGRRVTNVVRCGKFSLLPRQPWISFELKTSRQQITTQIGR